MRRQNALVAVVLGTLAVIGLDLSAGGVAIIALDGGSLRVAKLRSPEALESRGGDVVARARRRRPLVPLAIITLTFLLP